MPLHPLPGPRVRTGDGVGLATWDMGGDGPPLLLTHGTGFSAWMWLGAAPTLAASHRVWAVDLRGHGYSDPAPGRRYDDWWVLGTDLLSVVEALDIDRTAAAGHSMGAAALVLAELTRPGTFSSLWLYEPIIPPTGAPAGGTSLVDLARKRRNRFASYDEAVERYRGRPPFAAFAPGMLEAHVAHTVLAAPAGGVELVLPGPEEASCYEGAGHGAWDRLGELDLPVTVAASGDAAGPATLVPELAGRIAGARLTRFDDLTHMGPAEDPEGVAAAVLSAVDGSTDTVAAPR